MVNAVGLPTEMSSDSKVEVQKRRLKESCEEFESFLTGNLLKSMRESIAKDEDAEEGREIYESMMDEAVAREASRAKGLGPGEILYRQLSPALKTDLAKG